MTERTPRTHEGSATLTAKMRLSAEGSVERGLNDTRLAVLGIIVTIGLTVGFAVADTWWVGFVAGVGSFVLACALIRWRRSRHLLMSFMHWLTGS